MLLAVSERALSGWAGSRLGWVEEAVTLTAEAGPGSHPLAERRGGARGGCSKGGLRSSCSAREKPSPASWREPPRAFLSRQGPSVPPSLVGSGCRAGVAQAPDVRAKGRRRERGRRGCHEAQRGAAGAGAGRPLERMRGGGGAAGAAGGTGESERRASSAWASWPPSLPPVPLGGALA